MENNNLETTFDEMMPEIERTDETISPLSSLLSQGTEAIQFTHQLFLTRPEIFGENAEVLMYAQYSGHRFKPAAYYNIFEVFVKQTNKKLIDDKRNGVYNQMNPFKYDTDYLITWARIIQRNQIIIEFEPIMKQLKTVFNNWLSNPKINYGGIDYNVSFFHPLCYTYSGENITSLLPYIAYLFTFFIYCNPYEFDEGQSESSTFGFYKAIDDWYMKHYTQLANDTNIDVIKGDLTDLAKVSDKYWVDMLNHMLNVSEVIRIRNDEISRTPQLLEQCIADQNEVSYNKIDAAYRDVLTNLIKICVNNSPIKKFFNAIPQFDNKRLNVVELMSLTEYALSGGNTPFIIEPEIDSVLGIPNKLPNYSYLLHGDPNSIHQLPSEIVSPQRLVSGINTFHNCIKQPFAAEDISLQMAIAYVKQEFDKKRTDILDDYPIEIDSSMLRDNLYPETLTKTITNLFVNGLWMYDNKTMSQVLPILMKKEGFASELSDILSLSAITQITYNNRQASILITPLILSYLNDELLDSCSHGWNLNTFSPMTYLCMADKVSVNRINKLVDMLVSLLYIAHPIYSRFVNVCINDFTALLTINSIIQQPYVKGLEDAASIYAIGGCELYNYSHFSNPLIRGYGWLTTVFGNSEAIETFYKWIYRLDNTALFEVINESLNSVEVIETSLKAQWVKMITNGKFPPLLSNFIFTDNGYKFDNTAYFLNLKTSEGLRILPLICQYVFPYSNPRRSIPRHVVFREIKYNRGKMIAYGSVKNGMVSRVNDSRDVAIKSEAMISNTGTTEILPVYDYNGTFEDVNLIWSAPRGRRCVKLTLFTSKTEYNQSIWIFTKLDQKTTFQRYATMENELQNRKGIAPSVAQKMYPDRADVARTRVIKDYLAKQYV